METLWSTPDEVSPMSIAITLHTVPAYSLAEKMRPIYFVANSMVTYEKDDVFIQKGLSHSAHSCQEGCNILPVLLPGQGY